MGNNNLQNEQWGHPCFDYGAHCSVGRIHLPVAPRCNIKCKYCSRKHDCANENRPGITSKIITPEEAIERVRQVAVRDSRIKVVGIAGPGDPLANEATLRTLSMVRSEFPNLSLCLSTNGLLLPEYMNELVKVRLKSLTVTINALDENVGAQIYSYVQYGSIVLQGKEAAIRLRDNQLKGVRQAVAAGIRVKVNSVLIPGINEQEMLPLARTLGELDISAMNIIPLIPQADFSHLSPVPAILHQKIREQCLLFVDQISHCRQCRADACGLIGESSTPELAGII